MNEKKKTNSWLGLVALGLFLALGLLALGLYWPQLQERLAGGSPDTPQQQTEHDDHAGHGADDSATTIELSEKALRNVGYQPYVIALQPFSKTTAVPAMVVERPGRSQLDVTAPMTGVITNVYPIEGEAVSSGDPLFDIRLTHEDLVTAQANYLGSLNELDVIERELTRMRSIGEGVIPGKRILAREYEKHAAEAAILAQREGLRLHGLSEQQVDDIGKSRRLLRRLTVVAPEATGDCAKENSSHLFGIQSLKVRPGQQVKSGDPLCVLADHCRLYIEGKAFEEDADLLNAAAQEQRKVSAVLMTRGERRALDEDLKILYLSDRVEANSRAFHFYVGLPNQRIRDQVVDGHRFVGWKYKPGQRLEVRIPIQESKDRIVLPFDAVVEEGAEAFVFQQNGDKFNRIEVHITDRDQERVVIANDGSLYPGDVIAGHGAYSMHLAMKNKAGGGVDPHAGHSH